MIRTANQADIDDIVGVVAAAFHLDPGTPDYDSRRNMILRTDPGQWRVCFRADRMVGALHIEPGKVRIGKSVLLKGDVGEVSILPDVQGGGIGTELMTDAVAYMRDNGFDLSRLGGLCKFYSRFGYVRFPRRTVEITVGKKMRAGYPEVFHGTIAIDLKPGAAVREAGPADTPSYQRLRDKFTSFYAAAPHYESPSCIPSSRPGKVVYVEEGEVLALVDFSEQALRDGQRYVDMVATFDPDNLQGLKHLLAHSYNYALERDIPRISARLPFDWRVTSALSEMPIFFDCLENYGGMVSSMLQIVSLRTLFEHLKPELEHRLRESDACDWSGAVRLETERDAVSVAAHDGVIEVASPDAAAASANVSESRLLHMVLGLLSFAELADSLVTDPQAGGLLTVLFPRRPVYSGGSG